MKKDGKDLVSGYSGRIFGKTEAPQNRILVGVPATGTVRMEWVISRYHQIIPCNWGQVDCLKWLDQSSPMGFLVAEARNVIATECVENGFEWLFFLDQDVCLGHTAILKFNERMLKCDVPVFGGLYFTKSVPSEPLVYRGRGNSYHGNWKMGDEVWVDGMGMGSTMIHSSILKVLYDESEEYDVMGRKVRRIFETPAKTWFDPETKSWFNSSGTEDLALCSRIMRDDIFKKAGWPKFQRKKYPFLIDTSVFSFHIDPNGVQYPSQGEHLEYIK